MNIHKISAATIARTACLLLALTNQLLSACGKPVLPIESQTVEQLGIPHPGSPAGHVTISLGVAADVIEQRLDENGGRLKFSYTLDSGAESFISRNLVDITVDKLPEA